MGNNTYGSEGLSSDDWVCIADGATLGQYVSGPYGAKYQVRHIVDGHRVMYCPRHGWEREAFSRSKPPTKKGERE